MPNLKHTFVLAALTCGCLTSFSVYAQTRAATRRPANTATRAKAAAPSANAPAKPIVANTTTAQPGSAPIAAAKDDSCGCETPLPGVLAVVNGTKITAQELDASTAGLGDQVSKIHDGVIAARKHELDLQINSKLLAAEARRRNVSLDKLLNDEVNAKVAPATETDAQAFYEQNQASIGRDFKEVRGDIIAYLTEQRRHDEGVKLAERLRAGAQVKVLVAEPTPPTNAAERARTLALVNNAPITAAEVEDSLRPLIFNAQQQVYQNRRQALDRKINDLLLEAEAKRRNSTPQALLDAEVKANIKPVTDADAQTFYAQNRAQINGDYAQIKDQLIQYLQAQAEEGAVKAYVEQLRAGASIQTYLSAPESPVFQIATDDQPSKGNPAARVTVIEFTDFQCPSCAQTHPVLERLMSEYADRVRFVVRDFPLGQHQWARKAAEAAEAAREQGKYWEYIALLFRNQSALDVPQLKQYATQLGLDRARFDAALDSGRYAANVQRDLSDGNRIGVNATPSLFVNGQLVADRSYEVLKAKLDALLAAKK